MEEDWVLYFVTSFTFVVIFFFCYVRYIFTFFERHRIQCASYPSFPFGNVYDVLVQQTPMFMQLWKFYNKLKRKGSCVGGFYIFTKPAILVLNSRKMEDILSTKKSPFEDINVSASSSLNNIDGELSEELQLRVYKNVENIWPKILLHFPKVNEEVNITDIIDKLLVITMQEFFGLSASQWPEKKFSTLENQTFLSSVQIFLTINHPGFKKYFSSCKKYDQFCTDVFQTVIEDAKNTNCENLLQVLRKNKFSHEETMDFVQSVIYKSKIIKNLVLFLLFELSVNEEIQDELRHEITKFKNSTESTYKELLGLPYLEAVICETLRKYPSEPFVGKYCNIDYSDGDINVSKGTSLFVSIFGIHHDKEKYSDPELFDPDRFFEGNLKFIDSKNYIPFGCKDKNNFGSILIKLFTKLILVGLLTRFKFSLGTKSQSLQFDESCFEFLKLKLDISLIVNKLIVPAENK